MTDRRIEILIRCSMQMFEITGGWITFIAVGLATREFEGSNAGRATTCSAVSDFDKKCRTRISYEFSLNDVPPYFACLPLRAWLRCCPGLWVHYRHFRIHRRSMVFLGRWAILCLQAGGPCRRAFLGWCWRAGGRRWACHSERTCWVRSASARRRALRCGQACPGASETCNHRAIPKYPVSFKAIL